jgi:hypothetical protein
VASAQVPGPAAAQKCLRGKSDLMRWPATTPRGEALRPRRCASALGAVSCGSEKHLVMPLTKDAAGTAWACSSRVDARCAAAGR